MPRQNLLAFACKLKIPWLILIYINPKTLSAQTSQPSLIQSIISPLIVISGWELVIDITGGDAGNQDRQKASEEAGHSVEVVDATGVMDLELVQEERLIVIIIRITTQTPEFSNKTWMYLKPHVDRMPARAPTVTAPPGVSIRSAHAPTATPPARVAFWRCSMLILLLPDTRQLMMVVAMVQEHRE